MITRIKNYIQKKRKESRIFKLLNSPESKTSMEVYDLEESDSLWISMGISEERFTEISRAINRIYAPGRRMAEMIAELSKCCNNKQELAFSMYILGAASEKIKNPMFWATQHNNDHD